jgi:hypothetical protein
MSLVCRSGFRYNGLTRGDLLSTLRGFLHRSNWVTFSVSICGGFQPAAIPSLSVRQSLTHPILIAIPHLMSGQKVLFLMDIVPAYSRSVNELLDINELNGIPKWC